MHEIMEDRKKEEEEMFRRFREVIERIINAKGRSL